MNKHLKRTLSIFLCTILIFGTMMPSALAFKNNYSLFDGKYGRDQVYSVTSTNTSLTYGETVTLSNPTPIIIDAGAYVKFTDTGDSYPRMDMCYANGTSSTICSQGEVYELSETELLYVQYDPSTATWGNSYLIFNNSFYNGTTTITYNYTVDDPLVSLTMLEFYVSTSPIYRADSAASAVCNVLTETALTLAEGDTIDHITSNFTVPTNGTLSTVITWSETSDYINSINAASGLVTISRPSNETGDQTVTLTASVQSADGYSNVYTKQFSVTIAAEDAPPALSSDTSITAWNAPDEEYIM